MAWKRSTVRIRYAPPDELFMTVRTILTVFCYDNGMIKAVIFDWGGVIAPNPNGGWMNVLMEMLNISFEELKPRWDAAGYESLSKGLITDEDFWTKFQESFGKTLDIDTAKVWADGSALQPYPGFLEFIQSLRDAGLKTAVLSNTIKPLSTILRSSGLYSGFDEVVLSDESGLVKPDTAIYEDTVQRLGVSADECIYIDDLERNLLPAQSMGMITILADGNPNNTISKIKTLV